MLGRAIVDSYPSVNRIGLPCIFVKRMPPGTNRSVVIQLERASVGLLMVTSISRSAEVGVLQNHCDDL